MLATCASSILILIHLFFIFKSYVISYKQKDLPDKLSIRSLYDTY